MDRKVEVYLPDDYTDRIHEYERNPFFYTAVNTYAQMNDRSVDEVLHGHPHDRIVIEAALVGLDVHTDLEEMESMMSKCDALISQ